VLLAPNAWAQPASDEQSAQPPPADAERAAPPPRGAEVALPLGSLVLPGLGQVVQHAPRSALMFSGVFLSTLVSSRVALNGTQASINDLDTLGSRAELGVWLRQISQEAGALSAYDSFRRSLPALRRAGKYEFMSDGDPPSALLTAAGEFHFLKEKTTYIPIAIVAALSFSRRLAAPDEGKEFAPARGSDTAFSAGVAFNAGVGEEALYRGFLLPVIRQHVGDREWVGNGLQAAVFAAAHGDFSPAALSAHFAFGYYAGYLANRNHGSLRQAVFTHFMWDAVALSGAFLTRQRDRVDVRGVPVAVIVF